MKLIPHREAIGEAFVKEVDVVEALHVIEVHNTSEHLEQAKLRFHKEVKIQQQQQKEKTATTDLMTI